MPNEENVRVINPNDLSLVTEELEGFDPSADAHALPPPPADGVHRVKLSRPVEKEWKQRSDENGKIVSVGTSLRGDVLDEDVRAVLFDHRVSTRLARNGGCAVADVIRAITNTDAASRDHVGLMRELETLLQGYPIVRVETQWEASCQDCKDVSKGTGAEFNHRIKRGQRNFPLLRKGSDGHGDVRNHEIECDRCRQTISAQAVILRYLPDAGFGARAPSSLPPMPPDMPF